MRPGGGDPVAADSPKVEGGAHHRQPLFSLRDIAEAAVALGLIALSFVGVAGSDTHAAFMASYWAWLPLVFGIAAFWMQWRPGTGAALVGPVALRALGHWSAVWVAVYIVSDFNRTDHFTDANVGLANGLVFALATFLAGVHSNWRLMVAGAALAAAIMAEAYLEEKLWLLLALALAALIAIVLIGRARHMVGNRA